VRPSINHLQVLGCGAYIFIPAEIRNNKLAPKAELMIFLGMYSGGKGYIFMRGPNNIVFSAAHATFNKSMFPRCPKNAPQNNTQLQETAPSSAPSPYPKIRLRSQEQKELDRKLQEVGVTPSQRHGMNVPPPCASTWQDRPLISENIKQKQKQQEVTPSLETTTEESSSSPQPQPKGGRQLAALPLPHEKSTRKRTVPERYTEGNVYGKKYPVEVERDIHHQRDWRKVVGEESSRPHRQNIPEGVPVPDSVLYYSSDEEDDNDEEPEPHSSSEEDAVISRLSQEGGVSFLSFLVSKAFPTKEKKEPKEWTYRDMIGLPAGKLEQWRAACQREIETLTKRHVFDFILHPSGYRVIKNRWVFDVKPDGRKPACLVAKGFSQIEGMDFDQIFSPVVHFKTVRLILALAALEGWYLSGLDV